MIKYTQNEKVTVAKVCDCKYDAVKIIARRFPAIKKTFKTFDELVDNIKTVDSFNLKPVLMNDTYTAVVKLHESDTYDAAVGKKMASQKLNNRLDREIEKRIRKWVAHQHILLDYGVLNKHLKK